MSFRGREHSDRRNAPSEHRLLERSLESITTSLAVCDSAHPPHPLGVMDSALAGNRQNRPVLYYMRGPSPKWREKHARCAGTVAYNI
jgi:hypothetical protein